MRIHYALLFLLILPVIAFAIGGGGGGGSSPGESGGGSGSSGCSGVCDLVCLASGSIEFRSTTMDMKVTAFKHPDGEKFNVIGWWSGTTFRSDEAIFNESGSYDINGQSVVCPGLTFSCKLSNIEIKQCERKNNRIEVNFNANNTDENTIKVTMRTFSGKIIFYEKTSRSGGLAVSYSSGTDIRTLTLMYPEDIETIQIADKRCTGRYIVSDSTTCTKAVQEEKDEFKCKDFISMIERIKCRLALTPDEQEEEIKLLYLPEQCRALNGTEKQDCIKEYKLLRSCQIHKNRKDRIECAKGKLNVKPSLAEHCRNSLDFDLCKSEFGKRIYSLTVFRFYELEEKAEEWFADERIDLQTASEFVTTIEEAKIRFNNSKSYEERRNIILEVRSIWKEFIKNIK